MSDEQPRNPLHGITLKAMLEALIARYDWPGLAREVPIRCFENEPSLKSSLKFLRRTEWARKQVEQLYVRDLKEAARKKKRNKRRAARRAFAKAAGETSEEE